MSTPRILMCPPDFYGIEYEINPWMSRTRPADRGVAQKQWEGLKLILEQAGATIVVQPAISGLPDMVFTANAALIYRQQAILARFHHAERQGETPFNQRCLESLGFQAAQLSEPLDFEGAGDALFCGDTLYGGYRIRSHAKLHQLIGEMLDIRAIPLELVDHYYYHLDTCFCPLAPGIALYYPPAFDKYAQDVLQDSIPHLIAVDSDEARSFACNAVVIHKTVVTNTGCPRMQAALRVAGFQTAETPLSEFVKAGGSAKCLTLRLDGEEAANWRNS